MRTKLDIYVFLSIKIGTSLSWLADVMLVLRQFHQFFNYTMTTKFNDRASASPHTHSKKEVGSYQSNLLICSLAVRMLLPSRWSDGSGYYRLQHAIELTFDVSCFLFDISWQYTIGVSVIVIYNVSLKKNCTDFNSIV